MKTGLAAAASAAMLAAPAGAAVRRKAPGETKVVYLGGDYLHNGFTQEYSIRYTFKDTGWRIYSAQDARQITPEVISDADLLVITRWGGPIFGWTMGPLVDNRPSVSAKDDGYMSDALEDAIVDNVTKRGMGFMALHCTIWTPDREKFNRMMGIKGRMHGPVQRVRHHDFNQVHPVTRGMKDFDIGLDENFGVELTDSRAVALFKTTGESDHRTDIAGWALDSGNGRVVGLGAGHTTDPWIMDEYRELHWRAAHWAMKREIPPFVKPSGAWF